MTLVPVASLMEILPVAAAVVDGDGRIVDASEVFAGAVGGSRVEITGLSVFEVLPGGEALRDDIVARAAGGTVDLDLPRQGGDEPDRLRARSLAGADGPRVLVWIEQGAATAAGRIGEIRRRVARVKHAFNNQLMGLLGHAEILLEQTDLPEAVRSRANLIMKQTRRLGKEAQRLDAIARGRE